MIITIKIKVVFVRIDKCWDFCLLAFRNVCIALKNNKMRFMNEVYRLHFNLILKKKDHEVKKADRQPKSSTNSH